MSDEESSSINLHSKLKAKKARQKRYKSIRSKRRRESQQNRKEYVKTHRAHKNLSIFADEGENTDTIPHEAPRVSFVDGKLVINRDSLFVHAETRLLPPPNQASDVLTKEDLKKMSQQKAYHHIQLERHYLRKAPTMAAWTLNEEKKFFHALQMFGTDFDMIATFFPHRTRKQVRQKYTLEQKKRSDYVNYLLSNPLPFDWNWIKKHSFIYNPAYQGLENPEVDIVVEMETNRQNATNSESSDNRVHNEAVEDLDDIDE